MARFKRFLLTTLWMAAGWMIASAAEAQCVVGNPEMECDVSVCQALDAVVFSNCKGANPPKSCRFINGCADLMAETAKWQGCLDARENMKATCFPNATSIFALNHAEEIRKALMNIRRCESKMRRPKPIGCAEPDDPCN
jgi:hypothetical protein